MSWMLVLCLLGAGGMFPKTQCMDGILEINENLIPEDNPASSFLSEGDIILSVTSKFSPKLFLWPWVSGTVIIPYELSVSYDEHQRHVIFEAFKDLEASTCIRFVERTIQRDYISILPGNGCYSSVGRVGRRQVLSLAFQCIERGKGIVLHELMHAIGFWHEHSRADRDEYVTIHWNAIRKEYRTNFCKYETTNMVVKYDLESLLHYSRVAFAKSEDITIEPHDSHAHVGQRIKLSDSDILRVNKLYHCPQYTPSKDDDEDMVLDNPAPGVSTCSEANMNDPESLSTAVFTELPMAARLSSTEKQGSVSPPTEESKTSPVAIYSSSSASKTGSAPTSLLSQESKLASTGFIYSSTQELTHSNTSLSISKWHAALESTRGTAARESIQVNFTGLISQAANGQLSTVTAASESVQDNSTRLALQGTTKQHSIGYTRGIAPESLHEGNSTVVILHGTTEQHPIEPSRRTAAPESIQDNSTILIPQGTTHHPVESKGTLSPKIVHKDNSTVVIPHKATKHPIEITKGAVVPESVQEDNSTVLILHGATEQPSKANSAPETVHKDNSTVLIPHRVTKHPRQRTKGITAPEIVTEDNSTVLIPQHATNPLSDHSTAFTVSSDTNSKLNMGIGDHWSTPLEMSTTAFHRSNSTGEENTREDSTIEAIFESKSLDNTTVSSRKGSLTEKILPISIFMQKRTMTNVDVKEENPTLQSSASSQSSGMQQVTAEDIGSAFELDKELDMSQDQDHDIVRKRSLAGKTLGSRYGQLPRWLRGNKLTYASNNRSKRSSEIIDPFCGFEHGLCGWRQSTDDDLDWRLGWGSLDANVGHFKPEGFHLLLKSSSEVSVSGQKALLLRPIVQPSNCISFWYRSRHNIMGTLKVYIASSGGEQMLLWTSDDQDHVKWTKAQITLLPHLLYDGTYVVVEGVMGPFDRCNIAIDDLYVGQCN